MTSGEIMDLAAATYNDQLKAVVNYGVQLPYLNMAMAELQEIFEQNGVPVTTATSAIILFPAGLTEVKFSNTSPRLPPDLVEIIQAWERPTGIDPFIPMFRMNILPHYLEGQTVSNFIWWQFNEQIFKVMESNQSNDVKLDYVKSLFYPITSDNGADEISVINSKMFLVYRTGALLAQFIGENKTRADELNLQANQSIERSLGISTKARQGMVTRRRPFRASFKSRQVY